ncbi:ExeA family protein [Shewanella litorisediminis]|uniref:AAA family ATPase n=1 Tax=Shewanella litorisediminis TaxID=1173586 RepID=A0ABX7G5S6_9GAMM|nr:ExeA family protein [Shewanella litorisediminis]MCL2917452.1 AAA family ATPase [Shewanella litorisediminis]QRH02583.1 AAA family ATPase [Shewanella litorisediminis]
MYKAFYGLKDNPFSIAPNPTYLFLSDRHREALAHLTYGLGETGGFVLLTGEVGTGKTTVSRCLLRQLPDTTDTAFILNPALTELELLATLCDELKIPYGEAPSLKMLTDLISGFLLKNHNAGRNTVLIIDEAQHLKAEVLEQLRLLTNLETDTKKLLQVILIGQPELQQLLKRQELRQLAQRITARYHLLPLTAEEVGLYVQHRLQVAGRFEPLFNAGAIKALHKASGGIPRIINLLCERALMAGFAQSRVPINKQMVRQAAVEVLGLEPQTPSWYERPLPLTLATALTFGVALYGFNYLNQPVTAATSLTSPTADVPVLVMPSAPQQSVSVNQNVAEPLPPEPIESATVAQSDTDMLSSAAIAPDNNLQSQTSAEVTPISRLTDAGAELAELEARQAKVRERVLTDAVSQSRSLDTAYAALFGAWGLAPIKDLSPCESAREQGLSCFQQQGTWFNLVKLNYPAVAYMMDDTGGEFFVTVIERDGDELLVQLAEQQLWVNRDWFNRHFTGTFELFWQAPVYSPREIGIASPQPEVQWLENGLAKVDKITPRLVNEFDTELENRLKLFQRQHGLKADGIAGSQTLQQLNLYLSNDGPRLVQGGLY